MPQTQYQHYAYDRNADIDYGWSEGMEHWEPIPKGDMHMHNSFVAGLRETTLPGDPDKPIGESLSEAAGHYDPVERFRKGEYADAAAGLAGPVGIMGMDIARNAIEEGKQAWRSAKSGKYDEAAAHVGRATPILGPMAGQLDRSVQMGLDTGNYSRLGGNLTGIALQALIAKGGGALADTMEARAAAKTGARPVLQPPPEPLPYDQPAPTLMGRITEQSMGGRLAFRQ